MAFSLAKAFVSLGVDMKPLDSGLKTAKGKVTKAVSGMGASAKKSLSIGLAGAAIGITAGLVGMTKSAADFEHKLSTVATLGVEDMGALRQGVNDLAREFGISAPAQIKNLYDTLSAGVPEDSAIFVMREAARGAIAGVGELSDALDLGTSFLNAYNLPASQMTQIMGQAATAIKYGKTTMSDLGGAVGRAASTMATLNISSEEFLAAIAALTTTGAGASEQVSALKAAMANVIKPSAAAALAAAGLGLQFNAAAIQSKGLAGFLADVERKTGGNIDTMATLFGSVEGLNAVLALTGAQEGTFKKALAGMADATANLDTMTTAAMENDPSLPWRQAKEGFAATAREIGTALLPELTKLLDWLGPLATSTVEWITSNRDLIVEILKVTASVAGLTIGGKKLIGFIKPIVALGGPLAKVFTGVNLANMGWLGTLGLLVGAGAIGWKLGTWLDGVIKKSELGREALKLFGDALVNAWEWVKKLFGHGDEFALGERSRELRGLVPQPEDWGPPVPEATGAGMAASASGAAMAASQSVQIGSVSVQIVAGPGESLGDEAKRAAKTFVEMVRRGLAEPGALSAAT